MRETQDRDVVALAREVSRVTAESSDARQAVAAVRRALESRAPAARPGVWRGWLIGGGVAAAVAVACGTWMALEPRAVSAAAALQASTQATEAYRGWVHMTPEGGPFPIQDAKRTGDGTPVTDLKIGSMHINTADGTAVLVCDAHGQPFIQMFSPALKKQFLYIGLTHELRIRPLLQDGSNSWRDVPLNITDVLASIKKVMAAAPDIKETRDQGWQRFDLTYEDASRKKAIQETIWVDPQSKRIEKMAAPVYGDFGEKVMVMKYTYGDPALKDIYDAGVPRDARVVEEVAETAPGDPPCGKLPNIAALVKDESQDGAAIVARLKKRQDTDWGNFVMLECQQLKDPRRRQPEQGSISLVARQGDKAFAARHLVAPLAILVGGSGFPPHWPQPSLDEVLPMMKTSLPSAMEVINGASAWQGEMQGNQPFAINPDARPEQIRKIEFQLGAVFWRAPQTMSITSNGQGLLDAPVEVLRDPARPGLIVLHSEQRLPLALMPNWAKYHADRFVWIDPAHDDLTVESLQRTNTKTDELDSTIHEVVLEFGRLKNNAWFPAHWQYKSASPPEPGVTDSGYVEVWRQFFPENALPAEWYENPTPRLSGMKPLFRPSSQPAATNP
jgi:hypothetical protein